MLIPESDQHCGNCHHGTRWPGVENTVCDLPSGLTLTQALAKIHFNESLEDNLYQNTICYKTLFREYWCGHWKELLLQ